MARHLSEVDKEFICRNYQRLGATELARKLGCNRSTVQRVYGSAKGDAKSPQIESHLTAKSGEPQSQLDRLKEARDSLRLAMLDAPPQAVAGIVREYRATIEEIDKLEGGGRDDPAARALDAIAESIAAKLPTS